MSVEDFKTCARANIGDQVDAWDEVVIQNLIDVGKWWKELDTTVQWAAGGILLAAGGSAIALLAAAVGMTAATVVLPILAAFAVGVGIGAGLLIMADCADDFVR